jgi:hypothetical protein
VVHAQMNLIHAGSEVAEEELVADKGYHKAENLAWADGWGVRTFIGRIGTFASLRPLQPEIRTSSTGC